MNSDSKNASDGRKVANSEATVKEARAKAPRSSSSREILAEEASPRATTKWCLMMMPQNIPRKTSETEVLTAAETIKGGAATAGTGTGTIDEGGMTVATVMDGIADETVDGSQTEDDSFFVRLWQVNELQT